MKKLLSMTFALSVLCLSASEAQQRRLTNVAASLGSLGNPFFVRMAQGVSDRSRALGGPATKVVLDSADYDLRRQSAQVDDYISRGVDILVLNAVDPKGMVPAVKRAKAAGMTVIAADVGIDEGADALITSNNVQAGALACQFIADRLLGTGSVVILNGPAATAITDRVRGCKSALAKYTGIKILSDDQNAEVSRDGGLRVMTELLKRFQKIDAVFAVNDPSGLGAEVAIRRAKRAGTMFITGVDGGPDAEAALRDQGSIYLASAAQDPYTMAAAAVQLGQEIRDGKRKSGGQLQLIPVRLITRENISTYKGWR
jgi:ribose transport system substrate-binding protein